MIDNFHHRGKLYPVSGKTFLHINRTTLFDLSKCFLGNRDNFCPYEQALKIKIDLTLVIPLVLNEIHLSRLEEHSVEKLVDNRTHAIPHTKHGGIWRPSFSLAEFQMLKNLLQMLKNFNSLYKCRKFCRDINNFNPIFGFDLVPSHYLKTFLFNYMYVDKGGSNVITTKQQEFTLFLPTS